MGLEAHYTAIKPAWTLPPREPPIFSDGALEGLAVNIFLFSFRDGPPRLYSPFRGRILGSAEVAAPPVHPAAFHSALRFQPALDLAALPLSFVTLLTVTPQMYPMLHEPLCRADLSSGTAGCLASSAGCRPHDLLGVTAGDSGETTVVASRVVSASECSSGFATAGPPPGTSKCQQHRRGSLDVPLRATGRRCVWVFARQNSYIAV